jgi:K+-sensing histidine kinase KdpD
VHVVPWVPSHAGEGERLAGVDATSLVEAARKQLEIQAKNAEFKGSVVCHIAIGDVAREVLQMAARLDADILVVGSHGRRGLQRALIGSVAERVVRGASCPVLVIRDKDYHRNLSPEIEPPCPDCLAKQKETSGKEMWCARHSTIHPKAHVHYEDVDGQFANGSMLIR